MRHTHPGPEEPQVVIDLGHGPHGRAGVVPAGFLLDRNSRRESLDGIYVRFLHQTEELPGIRGEGFHIPTLPLRVDRIEGERGLSRP